jgi:hypothetical protein
LRDASDRFTNFSNAGAAGTVSKGGAVVPMAIAGRRRFLIGKWVFRRRRAAIPCQHGHAGHRGVGIKDANPVSGPVLSATSLDMPLIGIAFELLAIRSMIRGSQAVLPAVHPAAMFD